jgi:hypothetical protein
MEKHISESGVTWHLFRESKCPFLDTFFEIYKKDRMHAKIVHANNKNKFSFTVTRDVLFEFPNGDFKISRMVRKYGMSVTNIVYNRESTEWSLSYKKSTKKFYYIRDKKIIQATFGTLLGIMPTEKNQIPEDYPIYKYLVDRFGWLRNIGEDSRLHSLSFGVIMSKKLFNVKKALSHIYGVPYPVADIISKNRSGFSPWDFIRVWKQIKRNLINVENLKAEFLNNHYFMDACRLGGLLGQKVNCSWSLKRLKKEHDDWSKQINDIVMKYEPVIHLDIAQVYKDFAEFSGYEILKTNHELINEGRIMRHCVGSYANSVNNGTSGIFRVNNHTLEVSYRPVWDSTLGTTSKRKVLILNQLKGVSNVAAPKDLEAGVKLMIELFNESKGDYVYPTHISNGGHISMGDGLFFAEEQVDVLPF